MTEDEWLACADPIPMMHHAQASGRVSVRKLRLLAAACSRRVWHLLVNEYSRRAIDVGERFADGLASDHERHEIYEVADDVWHLLGDAFDDQLAEPDNEFAQAITDAGVHPFAAAEAAEAALAAVEEDADALAAYLPAGRAASWVDAPTELTP